jgi:hypothetical protein
VEDAAMVQKINGIEMVAQVLSYSALLLFWHHYLPLSRGEPQENEFFKVL